ncbi:MAG: aminomethyl-transferring glycine dehydrogenase subunit GcvPA [Pyrinomonadaceae bacterium]
MAERVTRRSRVLISSAVHPEYLEVVRTYVRHAGIEVVELGLDPASSQTVVPDDALDQSVAAVIVQSPNFFGSLENLRALNGQAHAVGALMIVVVTEPISLGVVNPPGAYGADIVVAEGQSFGVPLSYGGPYVGLFATREKYARQMPGRLVGQAADQSGRRGFVLTLATREQHIRREKATSNICTNQGLIALAASIYMATMGRRGVQQVAQQCAQKAHYAASRIRALEGFSLSFTAPIFNEFVVRTPVNAADLLQRLSDQSGIAGGVALSRYYADRPRDLLICVTEVNTRQQIDDLVEGLARAAAVAAANSSNATLPQRELREALSV